MHHERREQYVGDILAVGQGREGTVDRLLDRRGHVGLALLGLHASGRLRRQHHQDAAAHFRHVLFKARAGLFVAYAQRQADVHDAFGVGVLQRDGERLDRHEYRRGHGHRSGGRRDEGGRRGLRALAWLAGLTRLAGLAPGNLADAQLHGSAGGRLLHALADEPGRAGAGGGDKEQDQYGQEGAKDAADAAGVLRARRRGYGFGSRHLGFDAYWAAGENGYLVDESILPQIPPRLGGEKQGESRVSQAIAALRTCSERARSAWSSSERINQGVGVAGNGGVRGRRIHCAASQLPTRLLAWRAIALLLRTELLLRALLTDAGLAQ